MLEPPPEVSDADVLAEVRRSWEEGVDRVAYAALGFGAHHWTAYAGDEARLFVTYDQEDAYPRSLTELEAAYDGAAALATQGLEFVLAPTPASTSRTVVPFGAGGLSCTPWLDGVSDEPLDLAWTGGVLRRLHQAEPPALPRWRPVVGPDLAATLGRLTDQTWGPGPYADDARSGVSARLGDIERWTARYHHLAELARSRAWVAAHGEPHHRNQLRTSQGHFLIDWDTLRLAPPELDLRVLVENGADPDDVGADREMLELFDLQWRLDEINQYAAWFAAPHTGTRDDEIAFGGLREELGRPEPDW